MIEALFLDWCKRNGYKPEANNAHELKPGTASLRYTLPVIVNTNDTPVSAHVLARNKGGAYLHPFGTIYLNSETLFQRLKE